MPPMAVARRTLILDEALLADGRPVRCPLVGNGQDLPLPQQPDVNQLPQRGPGAARRSADHLHLATSADGGPACRTRNGEGSRPTRQKGRPPARRPGMHACLAQMKRTFPGQPPHHLPLPEGAAATCATLARAACIDNKHGCRGRESQQRPVEGHSTMLRGHARRVHSARSEASLRS